MGFRLSFAVSNVLIYVVWLFQCVFLGSLMIQRPFLDLPGKCLGFNGAMPDYGVPICCLQDGLGFGAPAF